MAFSTTSFHFPRYWTQVIQFLTLIWQMSCLTLSSHLYLGVPCDLLVRGFHLNIFLTVPVSGILCTWPNQLSLWALIWLTIFLCFISLSNSSFTPRLVKKFCSSKVCVGRLAHTQHVMSWVYHWDLTLNTHILQTVGSQHCDAGGWLGIVSAFSAAMLKEHSNKIYHKITTIFNCLLKITKNGY